MSIGTFRKNFTEVKEEFVKRDFELLTTEDEIDSLSKTKLRYICPFHGEQTILWNNFKRGAGCRKCATEEYAKRQYADFNMI